MRWRAFVVAAPISIALLSACGSDPIGLTDVVAGAYTLRTVDGRSLPMTLETVQRSVRIVDGGVTLSGDGTYVGRLTAGVGGATPTPSQSHGTYTAAGTALTFHDADGSVIRGIYANGAITVTDGGVVLVYRRSARE